ncbi:MAG: hypothetical protein AAF403_00535, partial [Pseudomonadota bacterium]
MQLVQPPKALEQHMIDALKTQDRLMFILSCHQMSPQVRFVWYTLQAFSIEIISIAHKVTQSILSDMRY